MIAAGCALLLVQESRWEALEDVSESIRLDYERGSTSNKMNLIEG